MRPLIAIFLSTLCIDISAQSSIEQITITATRTNAALDELSSNLTTINAADIQTIQAEHINQVLSRVPGAWISRGNGQEHLTAIRSPVLTGAGGCGAFFMAQDGISVRAPGFCNANQLFDINSEQADRIEVVRGPASVLYGSNAVHGVINVLTPDVAQMPTLSLSLESGEDDYLRGKVAAGVTGQAHNFGILLNGTDDGGFQEESGFAQQKVTLLHEYQGENVNIKNVVAGTNLNQETAGFIRGFDSFRDPELKRSNPNPEAFRDNQSVRAYSQISVSGKDGATLKLTPYLRWSSMTFLQHFLPWQATETNSQRSLGMQAQYSKQFNNVALLSGFDVDLTQGELAEFQEQAFSATIPQGEHYDYVVDAQIYSPFVNLNWQVSDSLRLDAGLRYEKTRYEYDNRLSDGDACEAGVENCRFTRPTDQTNTFEEWSYQAGLHYQLAQNSAIYGKYSNGYRAPQATELYRLQAGQQVADLRPEVIRSLELGWRYASDTWQFDVTAFDMQKDNFIFQDSQRQNISNGSTEHYGVELLTRVNLGSGWYTAANATFAKHRYVNDLTLSRTPIAGNEIDTAPEHIASAQLGWLGDNNASIEFEWVHQGNYFLDPQNTATYRGHNLLHIRANYPITESLQIGARVLNLTNVDYAERADFAFGSYRYFVGKPRSVFFTLRYRI